MGLDRARADDGEASGLRIAGVGLELVSVEGDGGASGRVTESWPRPTSALITNSRQAPPIPPPPSTPTPSNQPELQLAPLLPLTLLS